MNSGGGQNAEGTNAGGIFVQFNQDCTSLVAGSSNGYHLFALTADDGVEEIYASRSGQETCLVDRLFSSSLVAIVTLAAPRKLIVCHYKKGTEICNYSYSNTILAVKLNRSRLVVCLEESLHIHNIRDMKILHTIRDTPPNPRGLCALAPSTDRCLLAYPGSACTGEVQIFDAVHLNAKCVLSAHDAPLAALAWSACGRRLATASERGTVIRVFSVPERARLYELRRGVKRCVRISCLAFSSCARLLAAASNTETVHVFRLQEDETGGGSGATGTEAAGAGAAGAGADGGAGEAGGAEEAGGAGAEGGAGAGAGWVSWLTSAVAAGAGLLPAHVGAVLSQGRAFAAARLPQPCSRVVCAITTGGGGGGAHKASRLVVATGAGQLYVFALDAAEGGECALLRTHALVPPPSHTSHPPHTAHTAHTPPAPAHAAALRDDDARRGCGGQGGGQGGGGGEWPAPAPGSYADKLSGRDLTHGLTDSVRDRELGAALEGSPPRGSFDLRDPRHFPPMRAAPAPAPALAPLDQ